MVFAHLDPFQFLHMNNFGRYVEWSVLMDWNKTNMFCKNCHFIGLKNRFCQCWDIFIRRKDTSLKQPEKRKCL